MSQQKTAASPSNHKKNKVKNFNPSVPYFPLELTAETKNWQIRARQEEAARERFERQHETQSWEFQEPRSPVGQRESEQHPLLSPSSQLVDPEDPHNDRRIPRAIQHRQNEVQNKFQAGRYYHAFSIEESKDLSQFAPPSPTRAAGVPSSPPSPFARKALSPSSSTPTMLSSQSSKQQLAPAAGIPSSPPARLAVPVSPNSPKVKNDIRGLATSDFAHLGAPVDWTSIVAPVPEPPPPVPQREPPPQQIVIHQPSRDESLKIRMDLRGNDSSDFVNVGAPMPWASHQEYGGQSAIKMRHQGVSPSNQLRKARKAEAQARALARARAEAQAKEEVTPRSPSAQNRLSAIESRPVPQQASPKFGKFGMVPPVLPSLQQQ